MNRNPLSRLRRGIGHLGVIGSSLLRRRTRDQLAHLIGLLHASRQHLKAGGLPGLMRCLDDAAQSPLLIEPGTAMAQAEALAALYPMRGLRYCMRRTILRYTLLRAGQQPAVFTIGASRPDRALLAGHAWIELDGSALEERDDQHRHMAVMYQHPASVVRRNEVSQPAAQAARPDRR